MLVNIAEEEIFFCCSSFLCRVKYYSKMSFYGCQESDFSLLFGCVVDVSCVSSVGKHDGKILDKPAEFFS